jgi:hypothetical protein
MGRRKAWYWAVLSSLALFTGIVGLHDVLYALDLGSRVLAAFFIATCLVSVASVIGIARRRFWGLQTGIIAGIFGALAGMSLLLFQYFGGDVDRRIAVWLVGAGFCLSVAVLLESEARSAGVSAFAPIQRVAIGISATLIGLLQFWYTSTHAPNLTPPSVDAEVILERGPTSNGFIAVRGIITVTNTSDSNVRILGSFYRVTGYGLKFFDDGKASFQTSIEEAEAVERFAGNESSATIDISYPFSRGSELEAGQHFINRTVTYVPVGRFDLVEGYVKLHTAAGGSLRLDYDHEIKTDETDSETSRREVRHYRPIREPSWITDLTRFERAAEAIYSYQPNQTDSQPNWDYLFCHDDECGGQYGESLGRKYGARWMGLVYQLPLVSRQVSTGR